MVQAAAPGQGKHSLSSQSLVHRASVTVSFCLDIARTVSVAGVCVCVCVCVTRCLTGCTGSWLQLVYWQVTREANPQLKSCWLYTKHAKCSVLLACLNVCMECEERHAGQVALHSLRVCTCLCRGDEENGLDEVCHLGCKSAPQGTDGMSLVCSCCIPPKNAAVMEPKQNLP